MSPDDRILVWLRGDVGTEARLEASFLLRRLQRGEKLTLPHSRPQASAEGACIEFWIVDQDVTWAANIVVEATIFLHP